MGMVTRLTKKHQTTIPVEVRRALGLSAGDRVAFEIEDGVVTITKARAKFLDEIAFRLIGASAMRDWDTPEDDEAFRDL